MPRSGGIGGSGGVSPSDFEYDHPEVLEGGGAVSEGAESEAAAIASSRAASTARRPADDFGRWITNSVAIAADGGPATANGYFNRSVYGTVTVHRGVASFTRKMFNQPAEPARAMTASERASLATRLEAEAASATGAKKQDLRTFASMLRSATGTGGAGGDLPGPIMTMAVGEFGRAVAGMIEERLASENDAGLDNTLKAFFARAASSTGPKASSDFNLAFEKLKSDGKLDDLALELVVRDREFVQTHPNVRYYGMSRQVTDAVGRFGTAAVQRAWAAAVAEVGRKGGTSAKDGKLAGEEVANEVKVGLAKPDVPLVRRAAERLLEGVAVQESFPPKYRADAFCKARLNAAVKGLADAGKLDDMIAKLGRSQAGRELLDKLGALVHQNATQATHRLWHDAGGGDGPRVYTTLAMGEEGRGPGGPP